jgi:sulfite reductase alpha subunit-like flavoprotein
MKLWQVLESLYPLPTGLIPIPDNELLPPRYIVSLCAFGATSIVKESPPLDSFPCKVKQNRRITAPGHWQDVRHIILESQDPGLDYEPGDIAVVWPENAKEEVDIFLDTLHWTDIADSPLTITSALTGTHLNN